MPARHYTLSHAIEGVEGLYRPASFPPSASAPALPDFGQLVVSRPESSKPQPGPSWPSLSSHASFRTLPASVLPRGVRALQPEPEVLARRRRQAGQGPLAGPSLRPVQDSPQPCPASRAPCGQFVWSFRMLVQPSQSRREGVDARLLPCRQHSAQHRQPGVTRGRAKGVTGHKRARRDSTESMSPVCCLPAGKLRLVAFSGIACCLAMPPSLRP